MTYDNWLVAGWEDKERAEAEEEARQERVEEIADEILRSVQGQAECLADTDPELFLIQVQKALREGDRDGLRAALRPAALRLAEQMEADERGSLFDPRSFGPDRDYEYDHAVESY